MNEQEAIEKLFETAIERLDYKSSMPKIDVLLGLIEKEGLCDNLDRDLKRVIKENNDLWKVVKALKKTIQELKPHLTKRSKKQLKQITLKNEELLHDSLEL